MDVNQKYTRSSKIAAVFRHIEEVLALKEKCVVFSQWVSMLDLIEFDLKQNGIKFTVNKRFFPLKKSYFHSLLEARW